MNTADALLITLMGMSIIAVNLPFLPLAIYVLYRDKHGFVE